jgi:hypothetical protein
VGGDEISRWVWEQNVRMALKYLSRWTEYRFDDTDWQADETSLPQPDADRTDGWYDYPLGGQPPLTVWLAVNHEDTSVTRTTVEALMRRGDEIGLTIIATALTSADDNHADWVAAGVADGLAMSESARGQDLGICQQLEERRSRATQRGVLALRAMLAEAGPIH